MCVDITYGLAYRHVCRHVYRHSHARCCQMCGSVCRNVQRHVCRHVYRHVYRHAYARTCRRLSSAMRDKRPPTVSLSVVVKKLEQLGHYRCTYNLAWPCSMTVSVSDKEQNPLGQGRAPFVYDLGGCRRRGPRGLCRSELPSVVETFDG